MEVPDLLVVTKADLGAAADRARRDLQQAVGAVGSGEVPVLAVSTLSPPAGIEELVDALDARRAELDADSHRPRSRRLSALREVTAEHGERGLRALGGRREAERWLASQPGDRSEPELARALEVRAV
jgi:LAO/AO transport system kinase